MSDIEQDLKTPPPQAAIASQATGPGEGAVTCPRCDGNGKAMRFIPHENCSTTGACETCNGAGTLPADAAGPIVEGIRMRKDRRSRGLTVKQEAARLGIPMQDLMRLEYGLSPLPKTPQGESNV